MTFRTRSLAALMLAALALAGCDFNRTAKAQRQEYRALRANGPDYTPAPNQLTRRMDYFNQSEENMLEKMRQR